MSADNISEVETVGIIHGFLWTSACANHLGSLALVHEFRNQYHGLCLDPGCVVDRLMAKAPPRQARLVKIAEPGLARSRQVPESVKGNVMFIAQLANFLTACHHAQWVTMLFGGPGDRPQGNGHLISAVLAWAARHGFTYQR